MRKKTSRQSDSLKTRSVSVARAEVAPATPTAAGVVVAVELGAEFPALAASPAQRRVLSQLEGETPAAFAERVTSALDSAFGRGVALGQLTLACNERLDDAAQLARRQVAGAALGAMAKHHAGKVQLSAGARSSGRLRHGLSALARGLFDEWRTAGLEATVDFGEEPAAVVTHAARPRTARVA